MSSVATLNKKKVCINPLVRKKCSSKRRQVQDWMIKKIPNLTSNDYICDTCRNQIRTLPTLPNIVDTGVPLDSENVDNIKNESNETDIEENVYVDADDKPYFSKDDAVNSLNKFLEEVDISPIKKEQLRLKQYCKSKMTGIINVLKSSIFEKYEPDNMNHDGDIMLQQLKQKFAQSSDRSEKVKLLTLVPRSWSTARTVCEFPGNFFLENAAGSLRFYLEHLY